MSVTLPDNKEGYTMADQTSNEISHVQSVNRGRELQRSKIKTNLSPKHVPSEIFPVKEVPRTRSGKVVE